MKNNLFLAKLCGNSEQPAHKSIFPAALYAFLAI